MRYEIEWKPRVRKDLKSVPESDRSRILAKIKDLANDLAGDVKHLTEHTPEYRLRVGAYRVLFEIEAGKIIIYRVVRRRDAC
jgi:mRNA interferase RelE/StbE